MTVIFSVFTRFFVVFAHFFILAGFIDVCFFFTALNHAKLLIFQDKKNDEKVIISFDKCIFTLSF